MKIAIIVAATMSNVIGKEGKIPWRISSDLKYFKRVTMGDAIVMGRKTWESIGSKPLPGRMNIVVSTTVSPSPVINDKQDAGLCILSTVSEVLDVVKTVSDTFKRAGDPDNKRVFIIGGQRIYEQFMHVADEIYMSRISKFYEGDRFFPVIDEAKWKIVHSRQVGDGVAHIKYVRRKK